MKEYKIGDIVSGKVTGIESYGVFMSFENGVTGLIHISEISNSFVRNINDYVEMDEVIKAKIIGKDDSGHLRLSVKEISYRDKMHAKKIKETKSGFSTLGKALDKWVLGKLKEIDEKN